MAQSKGLSGLQIGLIIAGVVVVGGGIAYGVMAYQKRKREEEQRALEASMANQGSQKPTLADLINAGLNVYSTIKDAQVQKLAKELNSAGVSEDRMEKISAELLKRGYRADYIDPKKVASPVIGANAGWVVSKK